MANDLNRCEFIGRLGADPEIRYLPSGDPVASFRIACGSTWKDKTTGERKESTEWIPIAVFGGLAKIVEQYLRKGSRIYVAGRFKTRKWQGQDGQDRYTTEVVVDINGTIQILDGRQDGQGGSQGARQGGAATSGSRDARDAHTASQGFQAPSGGQDYDDIPFDQFERGMLV